jgi:hypothetical protein
MLIRRLGGMLAVTNNFISARGGSATSIKEFIEDG